MDDKEPGIKIHSSAYQITNISFPENDLDIVFSQKGPQLFVCVFFFNSLWPSDAYMCIRNESSLV